MRILFLFLLIWALPITAQAEKRVALVIGNSVYNNVPKLPNPSNDAEAMSTAFSRLGFDVTLIKDVDVTTLRHKLSEFAVKAVDADISAIFYAGHGIEVNGENYIIPVDAKLQNAVVVGFELISLNSVLSSIQGSKGLKLVFLDACRDNPFRQTMKRTSTTRSIGRGLATVEPDAGMVISYAAKAGTVAFDGKGEHSPYTSALLKSIEEPGLELQFLFRRVRDHVIRETDKRQEPFFYGSLPDRKFYLSPPQEKAPKPTVSLPKVLDPTKIDEAANAWRLIQNSADADDIDAYLATYGGANPFYQRLAKKKLAALQAEQSGKQPSPAAVQSVTSLLPTPVDDTPVQTLPTTPTESKSVEVAAVAPTLKIVSGEPKASPIDPDISRRNLLRLTQQELNRLGCSAGNPDGVWGRKSQRALDRLGRSEDLRNIPSAPSIELLKLLQTQPDGICPISCSRNAALVNGKCVTKTCPSGQTLARNGSCTKTRKNTKSVKVCPAGQKKNSRGACYTPKSKKAKVAKRPNSGKSRNSKKKGESFNACVARIRRQKTWATQAGRWCRLNARRR